MSGKPSYCGLCGTPLRLSEWLRSLLRREPAKLSFITPLGQQRHSQERWLCLHCYKLHRVRE